MSEKNKDIESKIEFTEELMKDACCDLKQNNVPPHRIPSTYKSIARDARDLGVYQMLLENEDYRDQFEKSVDYYLEGIDRERERRKNQSSPEETYWENEPRNLRDAIYTALLSQSETKIKKATESTLNSDKSFVEEYPEGTPWYYYAKALAATVAEDDQAQEYLKYLKSEKKKADSELVAFFEAIITILDGIIKKDTEQSQQGFQDLLEQYRKSVDDKPESVDETVTVEMNALLLITKRAGMSLRIENNPIYTNIGK